MTQEMEADWLISWASQLELFQSLVPRFSDCKACFVLLIFGTEG